MSSPLVLVLARSRCLTAYVGFAHAAALLSIITLAAVRPICGILVLPLLYSLRRTWTIHISRTAGTAIQKLEWNGDDRWTLILADGSRKSTGPISQGLVSPWLVILRFPTGGVAAKYLLVFWDSVDPERFRQLRLALRTGSSNRACAG